MWPGSRFDGWRLVWPPLIWFTRALFMHSFRLTATANTNMFTYEISPVFILMEKEIMRRMIELIGWSAGEGDGIFTPGTQRRWIFMERIIFGRRFRWSSCKFVRDERSSACAFSPLQTTWDGICAHSLCIHFRR
jgi:hypothetical protein